MWKVILLYLVTTAFASSYKISTKKSGSWWNNIVLYQIFPRSFKDSNGDGIGDLNGITSKLQYIKEFADAIWLSPIYPSPQNDFGYDISDFMDVHYEYGTLKDFDELVLKAKSLDLKVLLDFVPNHSSDQHEWFKKSIKRINPYTKYYVWQDGKKLPNGTRVPPNNWLSMFGGSAWEWNEERGQYYYHQFLKSQPDLNYNNPKLQIEMEKVINFWLKRGVDGFRVDAVSHLYEDPLLKDEPRSKESVPPDDYLYLVHNHTRDLDETYSIVNTWKELMDEYSKYHDRIEKLGFMEVGGNDFSKTMKFYSVGVDPMNFAFITDLKNDSTVADFKKIIDRWMSSMPLNKIANWIVGNHDVARVASRFGSNGNRPDQFSMLSAILPGMTVLYNGDEIGMINSVFTYEETIDPAGCNAGPDRYQLKSRDPQRTPYQWDDSVSAGFSTNSKTWLPVNDNYKTLNLAQQKKLQVSHYKIVKALSDLKRKSPVLIKGDTRVYNVLDKVLVVVRRLSNYDPIVILINFTDEDLEIDGTLSIGNHSKKMLVYVASMNSDLESGQVVQMKKIYVPKASTVVLTSTRDMFS
ncbi:alpha-glucosidase-like [Phymastichus coffea]|uniref:alpha-glucosidase-like n=1 Tax=Phymastichus coffea TaxID=108790 RepID=UPI00273C27FB|nr:alpha-glucosidase-like [Phymastichus coffea]